MKTFKKANEKLKVAEKALREAMIKSFPIGAIVFYYHGNQERSGKVESHNEYGPSLLIETKNRTKVWMDAVRIERVIV